MTNLIFGKYDSGQYGSQLAPEELGPDGAQFLNNFRADRYELWFTSTINFIPYNTSPVFTVDNGGNTKITGNLLTDKNLTVNGNTSIVGELSVNKSVNIGQNLIVNQIARVGGDLYVGGNIFSPELDAIRSQLAGLQSAVAALAAQ